MYPEISIGSIEIESYIIFYFLAYIIVALLLKREFEKRHYSPKLFIGLLITGIFLGMIGSKIYYILHNWYAFTMNPYRTFFNFSGSGWYGGFIFGGIGILIFLKINKLPILKFLDIMIPFVLVGQVIGRLGCFFGGCCHGTPSTLPWAVLFPNSLYPPHVKVHPTQLYEMIIYLAISIFLLKYKKNNLKEGKLFGLYLVLVGIGRFIVEFYRTNPKIIAQFSAPQILALIGFLFGVSFIFRANQSVKEYSESKEEQTYHSVVKSLE
jgi:phosphatidylglycerol---prolipoprotein diacylglyceryl transferase